MAGGKDAVARLRREVGHTALRARNGIRLVTGTRWAPIGPTPNTTVWQRGPVRLRHYHRDTTARRLPPVVLVGGLVGRADIFDLTAGNSVVARFLAAGFDTFVLDWGQPEIQDSATTLETYLTVYLPSALQAVDRAAAGTGGANLVGYCMGGSLLLHALPTQPDLDVRNLVIMASPVEFGSLNPLVDALREGRVAPESLIDHTGNLPPQIVATFFRFLKPTADLHQYAKLWDNLWKDAYLEGYQALNRCFQDHVPLAGATYVQLAEQWIRGNGFVEQTLRLDGRQVDLGAIRVPTLIITGTRDELIPPASTAPLAGLLTGAPVDEVALDAGHASLTTGRSASTVTLPRIIDWLTRDGDTERITGTGPRPR